MDRLARPTRDAGTLVPVGYTTEMDEYMSAADVLVGKPGGLTTSEALAKGLVFLIVNPIPGQEEWNADYVAGSGAGVQLRQPESVPLAALSLLEHPERLDVMRRQAAPFIAASTPRL